MTYEESATLMNDAAFRGRIKVAALKAATFYQSEDAATPGHNSRYNWAQRCFQAPDSVATQLQPPVVMDTGVQTEGAEISDAALQASVEATIGKII